jgi:hypothetical protein
VAEAAPSPRRLGRTLDVLGAAAAALLAFVAVPAALALVVGDPLSGGLGHGWQPAGRDALCAAALAAWVAWAACSVQLLRGVAARVRGGVVGSPATVVDRLAARIAVGVLGLSSLGGPLALSVAPPSSAVAPRPGQTALAARPVGSFTARAAPGTSSDPGPRHGAAYTVQRGDSLWSIADEHLQDGAAWTALASLNLGRDVEAGRRFVDPAHVRPGWHLVLPAGATLAELDRTHVVDPRRDESSHRARGSGSTDLPEIAALGMGSLVCAGLARRARRVRPTRFTGDPDVELLLSEEAVDTAALLHRFDGVPALTAFESANRLLGWLLGEAPSAPTVRAACVSPDGVTLWLAGHDDLQLPDGFVAVEDGAAWHVGHDGLAEAEARHPQLRCCPPLAPVVVPVGDDDEGTWLVALGPGQVLPVLGPSARALVRSMRSATDAWAWSDALVAADEATDPTLLHEALVPRSIARHLVYFGAPETLPAGVARRAAVVTTAAAPAGDLTVLVDRHGATIHPLGRVVRPHQQSEEVAASLGELLSSDAPARDGRSDGSPRLVRTGTRPRETASAAAPPTGTAAVTPGVVDVRLAHDDPPPRRPPGGIAAQPHPTRRGAGGLPGAALARRDHQ